MDQVSERVYVETGFHGCNTGFVDAGDGDLVLIDAPQLPTDAIRWASAIEGFGAPRYLITTDHHPDHTVGARWLGGTILAHRGTRERLLREPPSVEYLRELFGVLDADAPALLDGYTPRLPDITFDDQLELWVGDLQIQLLHAPGHTANTVMVYVPQDRVLFAGDNICQASLPAFVDSTVTGFFDAIDLAERLSFDRLIPGHGEVVGPEFLGTYKAMGHTLFARVARARQSGMSREECGASLRYEDHIHRDVGPRLADYPHDVVDSFQAASIEKIFDDLAADPELNARILEHVY